MGRYKHISENGVRFVFKYEDGSDDMLHIFVRHLTTPDDALDVWFDEAAMQRWNPQCSRFERYSRTHGIFWFWLEEPTVVMIVTCFREASDG